MRRALIAFGLIAGTLLPALFATVWLFGCCVLPFHQTLHRILPLCRIAMFAHSGGRSHEQPATTPAQEKRPAPVRLVTEGTAGFALPFAPTSHFISPCSAAGYRSFITLGALRCDRDVGLQALFSAFLI